MLIDWFTVGAQALNFLLLVWLLKRFLYQPILDAISAREQRTALQLADAAAALPLMTDLPIGVNAGGADVWADRDLFARDFTVGAPPDLFNTLGQDWAQPPWHPQQLRARAYAPLIAQAATLLNPAGILVLELGHNSADRVSSLLAAREWTSMVITNDLAGISRVASAQRNSR